MTGQLELWSDPCDTADPAPRPAVAAPDLRRAKRLTDAALAGLYQQLTATLANAPWPDENHTCANTATELGYVEREMQRRGIWWTHQPTDGSPNPEPDCRDWTDDQYAEWLHTSRPCAAITSDHGRPAGRPDAWRLFKPVTDVTIQGDLL